MLKSTFRLLILIPFLISVSVEAETKVSYYINLGGIKISDTTLSVNSNNEVWNIRSEISAAGIVDVIIEFRAFSESRGFIKGNKLIPETYSFSYETGKGRSRKGTLSYDMGIPFKLITQPEYDVDEKPDFDFLKEYGKETNDPYSALFVSGEFDDPCTYTAHGFDGIRAFKTKFIRPGKKEDIVINDKNFFNWLNKNTKKLLNNSSSEMIKAIKRSVEIKKEFIIKDEKDLNNKRALLNFGHTFAHSLESFTKYSKISKQKVLGQ